MLRTALRTAAVALPVAAAVAFNSSAVSAAGEVLAPATALDPQNFKPFKLAKVEKLSHDTNRYVFATEPSQELGMHAAGLLLVKADIDGKTVVRPYTPTSPLTQQGSFDLIVKAYPQGVISKWMAGLKEGDSVDMKGPLHKFDYRANQWKGVGMIAGGTGLTPMKQIIDAVLANPRDNTELRLILANRTPSDILLRKELEALAASHPQFKVLFVVDSMTEEEKKDPRNANLVIGRVASEMITSFLPPPESSLLEGGDKAAEPAYKILVCGPPGMMKHVSGEKKSPTDQGDLAGLLADLKYQKRQVFKY